MFQAAAPRLRAYSTRHRLTVYALPRSQPWACNSRISLGARDTQRASFSTAPDDAEHDVIREVFDHSTTSKSWFPNLRDLSRHRPRGASAGLFKNRYLTRPEGFHLFASRNIQKASVLVDRVLNASSVEEYRAVVRNLDRLSDLLCRVLDLCDFVRMTHPDPAFQAGASDAWGAVYQYMNQLNTTTGLNDQLCKALEDPDVTSAWTEEEMIVAKTLRVDFEKSAVHLPENVRDRFVDLSQQISELGSEFVGTMAPAKSHVEILTAKSSGLDPALVKSMSRGGIMRLRAVGGTSAAAVRKAKDEDTRKALYLASHTASRRTVALLEEMLRLRMEVASLTRFESYAHQHLQDRMMAKSPAAVMHFLKALQKNNAPVVLQELADLAAAKRNLLGSQDAEIHAWDSEFCKNSVRQSMKRELGDASVQSAQLSNYFSVGTVIKGLSILYSRLYGIRFVPRETSPGEVWHPEVQRLDVVSEKGNLVAVLYCDLFARAGKSPNPAHYTVRCSRDILDDEIAEAVEDTHLQGAAIFETPEAAANDGMEAVREDGVLKQLPTIVLVCDFAPPAGHMPSVLSVRNVETLFHEMGHAVHSILARTSFQNVAGTRCATDLAELPSTLMEHFAVDPTVLGLFARHWKTGDALPYGQLAAKVRLSNRFEGLDTERQIILAMVDQAYHSPAAGSPSFDSTTVYHQVQAEYAVGPKDDPSTSWQGFFGHLHGYGSTYYSYLFDRVLAERVWRVVFKAGEGGAAVSRENGEWLKENLLKWGGGRDPWKCLADTLKDERIAEGDEKAMAVVGSWGLKEGR
ncbi:related to mitochondrial intermediate peptidase precursor [Cephalotrichum gorgonifer]|uniref:Mitochondrial intermediate peptidase n=1 Tax=Cephalotrichum gorgonifer TaxID=2041049 RepID=A0AAE8MWQ6_9PEZI|nr:related to mitochondrial intermediate peptidase precursor [Cephalotrichum gorgonifer]